MGTKRKLTFDVTEDETTDGGTCWVVTCPQIHGFKTDDATIDQALEMAISLLQDMKTLDRHEPIWLGAYADAVTNGTRVTAVTYDGSGRRVELDGAAR